VKYIIVTFVLLLTITANCFSQGKWKQKTKEIRVDTVDIFSRLTNKMFNEKNTFRFEKNEVVVTYSQEFDDPCCVDDESISDLRIIFNHWDSLELNKDYNLAQLTADFQVMAFLGGEYKKPKGQIRLIKKNKKTLTFRFDASVASTDERIFIIFKGDREFKRD
jgi:hypothetical protein